MENLHGAQPERETEALRNHGHTLPPNRSRQRSDAVSARLVLESCERLDQPHGIPVDQHVISTLLSTNVIKQVSPDFVAKTRRDAERFQTLGIESKRTDTLIRQHDSKLRQLRKEQASFVGQGLNFLSALFGGSRAAEQQSRATVLVTTLSTLEAQREQLLVQVDTARAANTLRENFRSLNNGFVTITEYGREMMSALNACRGSLGGVSFGRFCEDIKLFDATVKDKLDGAASLYESLLNSSLSAKKDRLIDLALIWVNNKAGGVAAHTRGMAILAQLSRQGLKAEELMAIFEAASTRSIESNSKSPDFDATAALFRESAREPYGKFERMLLTAYLHDEEGGVPTDRIKKFEAIGERLMRGEWKRYPKLCRYIAARLSVRKDPAGAEERFAAIYELLAERTKAIDKNLVAPALILSATTLEPRQAVDRFKTIRASVTFQDCSRDEERKLLSAQLAALPGSVGMVSFLYQRAKAALKDSWITSNHGRRAAALIGSIYPTLIVEALESRSVDVNDEASREKGLYAESAPADSQSIWDCISDFDNVLGMLLESRSHEPLTSSITNDTFMSSAALCSAAASVGCDGGSAGADSGAGSGGDGGSGCGSSCGGGGCGGGGCGGS